MEPRAILPHLDHFRPENSFILPKLNRPPTRVAPHCVAPIGQQRTEPGSPMSPMPRDTVAATDAVQSGASIQLEIVETMGGRLFAGHQLDPNRLARRHRKTIRVPSDRRKVMTSLLGNHATPVVLSPMERQMHPKRLKQQALPRGQACNIRCERTRSTQFMDCLFDSVCALN